MKRILSVALAATLMPIAAFALSCAPFDPVTAFKRAEASSSEYVILYGTLEYNGRKAPVSHEAARPKTVLTARVVGQALSPRGFSVQMSAPVTLTMTCAGPWCPNLRPGPDKLMFLKRVNGAYSLTATPCASWAFSKPSAQTLDTMVSCINGRCPQRPRRR